MQLEKRNKKILVICPHPEGYVPGQRLKYEQYFESWRANGYDVDVSPFMSPSMQEIVYRKGFLMQKITGTISGYFRRIGDFFKIPKYDLVYFFLWSTPFGPPVTEYLICKLAKKVIYDIDDLVFLKNIKHENKLLGLLKGKNKPIYMIKNADHVISCTPYLDKVARRYNANTTDISSTINADTYIPVNPYTNDKQIVLGWSGSHSTSRYLYLLRDVLLELKAAVDFKLLVIGDKSFDIPGLEIEAVAWNLDNEVECLQKIDIGLYPLPLDDEWVLGKSGLKALQYMALGIPTIATDIGCNNRVITNNVSGYLVTDEQQWLSKLKMLCNDAELRKQIGGQARLQVLNHFSINKTAPVYLDIIDKVLKK